MILLNRKEIRQVFTMKDAIEANKEAYILLAQDKCKVPLRTQIPSPAVGGTFLFMPSFSEELGAAGLKIVNIFPGNADKGLSTSPASVLLMDAETGYVTAMMDGTCVTQMRTGAASGLAFELFARKDASIGALIGTGSQAACQLEAMLTACQLTEVRIFSRNKDKRDAFVAKMQEEMASFGAKLISADSADEAVDGADVIIAVTPSTVPTFSADKVKKGAVISGIGSYQHHMQELDPAIFDRCSKLYFDNREAVLSESGDITKPLGDGTLTEAQFTGDIGDVLLGKVVGRENDDEIIVYKAVGVGVQDLVAARHIFAKAQEAGVGTEWN
ncbi:MAG: NAD(P)-binding domain-containing protein [Oscillospiraceae bacterium]|nr:NAD(P)-binding domain-containing protein [Oscillospiraceae bacterium]